MASTSCSARGLQLALRSTTTTTSSRYTYIRLTGAQRLQTQYRPFTSGTQNPLLGKVVEPLLGTGPPPDAPVPSPEFANGTKENGNGGAVNGNGNGGGRKGKEEPEDSTLKAALLARRRKVAKALNFMREMKRESVNPVKSAAAAAAAARTPEVKRFWKSTSVKEVEGAYEIFLDSRPLRRPDDKSIIRIPLTKPHLANALALEWDQLTSSRDATKNHLLPLTSLVSRAMDITSADAKAADSHNTSLSSSSSEVEEETPEQPISHLREGIATVLMRYLDTDSLLCWSPPVDPSNPAAPSSAIDEQGKSLRDHQQEAYDQIVPFLVQNVWPGIKDIIPVLDEHSIMPKSQDPHTRETVKRWIERDLSGWELAGLERATLAAKSLLIASRLIAEWGEGFSHVIGAKAAIEKGETEKGRELFGIEDAARAASVEVDWQINRWGEVEDTHDVERADVRRQLGGVVLLVSGNLPGGPKYNVSKNTRGDVRPKPRSR